MTSPRLEEYARRAKLPIRVRSAKDGAGFYVSRKGQNWEMAFLTASAATRAYLQAVKELTE